MPFHSRCCIREEVMEGDFSDILRLWYMYFIEIYSSSLLFFISLCSDVIPLELGYGSNARCETPEFLGLDLRKQSKRGHSFTFYVIIIT